MSDNKILNFRFGKNPPVKDYRTFLFQNYLKDDIFPPPDNYSALDRVYKNLNDYNKEILFPMLSNDRVGNCTIVGMAHADTVWSGLVGNRSIYPEELVLKIYYQLSGGIDSGLSMLPVLEYFRKNLVAGEKIFAYVAVNPHNHTHVKQAIKLFGGLYVGFQVQEKCQEDFFNGVPWQPGKLINAGHAVFVPEYDTNGLNTLTWGTTQWGTWDWWDLCVDESYAILPPEAIDPKFAPGFDFDRLQKDLTHVSGWLF